MKKLFATLFLSSFICIAFAQQATFNPIHFKTSRETHWRPLDFNSESSGMVQRVAGVIDINTRDSSILITPEAQSPLKYKITRIDPEEEDKKAGTKTIRIVCKDSDGKECDTKIERIKPGASYMKVSVIYNSSLIAYFCDTLKNYSDEKVHYYHHYIIYSFICLLPANT